MARPVVDSSAAPPGSRIGFQAIGPKGTETGLNWFLSGPGQLDPNSGVYTVRDKSAYRAVITAAEPGSDRRAAAVVLLSQSTRETPLTFLVLAMGALGALLGAMRSFVNFVGSRSFVPSWSLYYFSRPVFGAGLALIVFFGYRIGTVNSLKSTSPTDPFAAAFVAGIVGLFADTVLQKLKELVTQLFRPEDPRSDKLSPAPAATPPAISALAVKDGMLTITGERFTAGATVSINGVTVPTAFLSATQITVTLPADLAKQGSALNVAVTNPDGATSPARSVAI
jgi:hypothetical protein